MKTLILILMLIILMIIMLTGGFRATKVATDIIKPPIIIGKQPTNTMTGVNQVIKSDYTVAFGYKNIAIGYNNEFKQLIVNFKLK